MPIATPATAPPVSPFATGLTEAIGAAVLRTLSGGGVGTGFEAEGRPGAPDSPWVVVGKIGELVVAMLEGDCMAWGQADII